MESHAKGQDAHRALPENVRVVVLRLFTHLALKLFPLWKTLDANSAHWEHLSLGFDVA